MDYKELLPILIAYDFYQPSDAVILLEGDGYSRINKACKLIKNKSANFLVFSGDVDNISAGSFPYDKCKDLIFKHNLPQEKLILDLISKNTREQAEQVVEICKINNWRSIILIASHYHQFRAFMTFLKVVIEEKLENKLIIYNAPENNLEWFKETGWGKRIDLLKNEFDKVIKYQKSNHIASYKEAIEYFQWRERNTKS